VTGPSPDDRETRNAAHWNVVRAAGRPAFHLLISVLTVVVWVGGEVAGNFLFRGGTIRPADLWDDVLVAVLLGNVLAWLFWKNQDARR
jgi:hypothetical protein